VCRHFLLVLFDGLEVRSRRPAVLFDVLNVVALQLVELGSTNESEVVTGDEVKTPAFQLYGVVLLSINVNTDYIGLDYFMFCRLEHRVQSASVYVCDMWGAVV